MCRFYLCEFTFYVSLTLVPCLAPWWVGSMDDESYNKTSVASKLKNKTPDTDSEESFKASQQSQSKSSVPPKITLCA